jgi:transcriptional regulator with GAF, ATPase, and Fis domain/pSer/pThr/pTyr-binding forkhead associated (FHA) protein
VSKPVLIVISKRQARAVFQLDAKRPTQIGRGPDNELVLNDDKLSRHHCVIRLAGDDLQIEDLKSLNGTRVNGRLIKLPTRLEIGDTVVLGNTTLIVESDDSPLLDTQAVTNAADGKRSSHKALKRAAASENGDKLAGLETEVPGMGASRTHAPGATSFSPVASDDAGETIDAPSRSQRLAAENENLRRVIEFNRQINSDLTTQKVLVRLVDAAIELSGAERGFLLLGDLPLQRAAAGGGEDDGSEAPRSMDDLKVAVARNLDHERIQSPKLSRTIVEKVLRDNATLLIADAQQTGGEVSEAMSIQQLSIQSVLCVPLRVRGRLIGALYLDHRWQPDAFAKASIDVIEAFSSQAALAIANARLLEEVGRKAGELERRNDEIKRLNEELAGRVEAQTRELSAVRREMQAVVGEETGQMAAKYTEIIGSSPPLMHVLKIVDKVADTDLPVYVHGEPGTGKELIARALHRHSRRAEKEFVAINCATFQETLLESELFGHVRGAFTNADRDKPGLFEQADGGTLFLDEIGEMSPGMQSKLLRVLQDGEFRRVGEAKAVRKVDVRVVSASNRDLAKMIEEKSFREDLFYRLHNVRVEMPPLRDRREDLPELIEHFLERICKSPHHPIDPVPTIDPKAMKALMNYHWPGNVRQLEQELKKLVALRDGDRITLDQLGEEMLAKNAQVAEADELGRITLKSAVDRLEHEWITRALKQFSYNKTKAAEALGLSRVGLRKKIDRLGVEDANAED